MKSLSRVCAELLSSATAAATGANCKIVANSAGASATKTTTAAATITVAVFVVQVNLNRCGSAGDGMSGAEGEKTKGNYC